MSRLELQALADLMERWPSREAISGEAHHGELEVVVSGDVVGYSLHVHEPVLLVRDHARIVYV